MRGGGAPGCNWAGVGTRGFEFQFCYLHTLCLSTGHLTWVLRSSPGSWEGLPWLILKDPASQRSEARRNVVRVKVVAPASTRFVCTVKPMRSVLFGEAAPTTGSNAVICKGSSLRKCSQPVVPRGRTAWARFWGQIRPEGALTNFPFAPVPWTRSLSLLCIFF